MHKYPRKEKSHKVSDGTSLEKNQMSFLKESKETNNIIF
jgi:hypothetical protein